MNLSIYYFKLLILGNPETTNPFTTLAFDEPGKDNGAIIEWYKEIHVFENKCELDLNVITDLINNDMDSIIPTADGIIYFLNPMKKDELDFFEIVLPIINSVKRGIPLVIIYHSNSGIIPISANELLDDLWINHPDLEGFVNLQPGEFHQVLQCLCHAIITGDTPLNIENAWMRYPIFIQLANIYYKNELYEKAARVIRKAAMIADIFNKQNYYIIAEKSALLFSEANLFLEASEIIENIDKKKSLNFKKLYAENSLLEGNKLFNKKKYEEAASKYLEVAHWSAIELKDQNITEDAFKTAISSWISACKVENAFQIFNSLDHDVSIDILKEISPKIEALINFLEEQENYIKARDQLYRTIAIYQREGLFEILENFTYQLEKILIKLIDVQLESKEKYAAKQSYDEIENLWESYNVKKTNLDAQLEKLITLFLDDFEFGMTSLLMNKINSKSLKKELTEIISKTEDQYKETKKRTIQENVKNGLDVVRKFIDAEKQIILELNQETIKESKTLIEKQGYAEAALNLNNLADYYKQIGKYDAQDIIRMESLNILLEGNEFKIFFEYFNLISNTARKNYLAKNFLLIKKKLVSLKEIMDFSPNEEIYEKIITIYREQMLYEQAATISEQFIELIKVTALSNIKEQPDKHTIDKVKKFLKKIETVSAKYLDGKVPNLDEIFVELCEVSLNNDDFSAAHEFCDKILNKMLKSELNKKIDKKESEKSKLELEELEKNREIEEVKERALIMRRKAQAALLDKKDQLRQRQALKRIYYNDALENLQTNDLDNALTNYTRTVQKFIANERYNIAGISLVMILLIYLSKDNLNAAKRLLEETKKDLSGLGKLIGQLFPFSLSEYLYDVKKNLEEEDYLKALSFTQNLALFEEENSFLIKTYGNIFPSEEESVPIEKVNFEMLKDNMNFLAEKIEMNKQERSKRKLMKSYWKLSLDDLSKQRYTMAVDGYFQAISKLGAKKFINQAALSLIIGSIIQLKTNKPSEVKAIFLKNLGKLMSYEKTAQSLPEIKFMDLLFTSFEHSNQELINHGVNILREKLFFFEPEIKLLESFLTKEFTLEIEPGKLSRSQLGELKKRDVKLEQEFDTLQKKTSDLRTDQLMILNKRKAMRRRYYQETLSLLRTKNFKDVAVNYLDLAKWSSERGDYVSSSLHLLLYGLTSFKYKDEITNIQEKVNGFLNSLGLNKRLVEDTFPVKCILFLIDLKTSDVQKYDSRLQEMLELLPLFEEEKELIHF